MRRAFGTAYEKDGMLVIPVALVAGGGGAGTARTHRGDPAAGPGGAPEASPAARDAGPQDSGRMDVGGGFGGLVLPSGACVVKGDQVIADRPGAVSEGLLPESAGGTMEGTQNGALALREAAMRLRPHRRNLVVWSQSAGPADGRGARRPARARRIRRWIRTCALLTLLGLMSVARGVRPRWRPVLAGVVLTVIGVILRNGPGNVVLLPGLLFLVAALLTPGRPDEEGERRSELERELALYSTPAQRRDLEATLDQYPDGDTYELREILARQAAAAWDSQFPGGPH